MVMRGPGSPNGGPRVFTHPASAAIPTLLDNEIEVEGDDETPEVMGNEGIDECCLRSAEAYDREARARGVYTNVMSEVNRPNFCELWRKTLDDALARGPEVNDPRVRAEMQRMAGNERTFERWLEEERERYEAYVVADRAWNECAEGKMGDDMFTASDIDGISWSNVLQKMGQHKGVHSVARDGRKRPFGWLDRGSDWSLAESKNLGTASRGGPAYTYLPSASRGWTDRDYRIARNSLLDDETERDLRGILATDRHESGHDATMRTIDQWRAPQMAFPAPIDMDSGKRQHTGYSTLPRNQDEQDELRGRLLDDPKFAFAWRQPAEVDPESPIMTHRRKQSEPQASAAHERAAFTAQEPFDPGYALARWLHHYNVGKNERKVAMRRLIEARKRAGMDIEGLERKGTWQDGKDSKGIPGARLSNEVAHRPSIDWRDPDNTALSSLMGYQRWDREKFLIPARERIRNNLTEAFLGKVYDWMLNSGQFATDRTLSDASISERMKAVERVARPMLKPLNDYLDAIPVDLESPTGESEGLPQTLMDLPEEFRMELGRLMLRRRLAEDFRRQNKLVEVPIPRRDATEEEIAARPYLQEQWNPTVQELDPVLSPILNTETGEWILPKGVKAAVKRGEYSDVDLYDSRTYELKDNVHEVPYSTTDNPGMVMGHVYVVTRSPIGSMQMAFEPKSREQWDPVTAELARVFAQEEKRRMLDDEAEPDVLGRKSTGQMGVPDFGSENVKRSSLHYQGQPPKRKTLNSILEEITDRRILEHLREKDPDSWGPNVDSRYAAQRFMGRYQ